jgi:hypothetical protein
MPRHAALLAASAVAAVACHRLETTTATVR